MKEEQHKSCQLELISIEIELFPLFSFILYLVFYMQEGIYWHKTNNHSPHSNFVLCLCVV